MLRQQSGRAKRHTHLCVFLLRPPLPKARRRGGRQFFVIKSEKIQLFSDFSRQKICAKLENHLKHMPYDIYFQETPNMTKSDLVYNMVTLYGVFVCIPPYIRLTSLFTVCAMDGLSAKWLIYAM